MTIYAEYADECGDRNSVGLLFSLFLSPFRSALVTVTVRVRVCVCVGVVRGV